MNLKIKTLNKRIFQKNLEKMFQDVIEGGCLLSVRWAAFYLWDV